ncbi:MAG: hypothetical protein GY847_18635 [Proteobacteria bacterium]|nr:hypothetical protein [Pseudomonadota bacterium]
MNKAILCTVTLGLTMILAAGCTTPSKIEVTPDKVVFEKAGATTLLQAIVLDQDGNQMSTKGLDIVWSSKDTKNVKLSPDGQVTAAASGETDIDVEIAGTEIKTRVPVRVKIPSSIQVSTEKLRLWENQIKENIWAEVRSEKGAFLEGFLPKWSSEDSSVVKVEPIIDPKKRQSWVKMTGVKRGTTHINATFRGITKSIRVAVFAEDEEVNMAGVHISKKKEEQARKAAARKKKKRRQIQF